MQAVARSEAVRFAKAVASEPGAGLLEVEAASPSVLVDRRRGLVYALKPHLVALDVVTGEERWSLNWVEGESLSRVGAAIVVVGRASRLQPRLVFIAPDAPHTAHACDLVLPAPREADEISVLPFERGGRAHVFWRGQATRRQGGPPPGEEEQRRYAAGDSCGVVALDTGSCAITPVKVADLLLTPPRDKGSVVPLDPNDCRYLMPEREMPAVAASLAPTAARVNVNPIVDVVTETAPEADPSCVMIVQGVVEAHTAGGVRLWRALLSKWRDFTRCPPPP